ncbi:MAG: hypothetical protein AAF939_18060 [Planctomycetota bacterium]
MRYQVLCIFIVALILAGKPFSQGQEPKNGIQTLQDIKALPSRNEANEQIADRRTTSFYQEQRRVYPYPATTGPSYFGQGKLRQPGFYSQASAANRRVDAPSSMQPRDSNLSIGVASTLDRPNIRSNSNSASLASSNFNSNPNLIGDRYASRQPVWGTTAYRQTAYQFPNVRTAQNCCVPQYGYNAGAVANFTPQAASQAPALNPGVGTNPALTPGAVVPGTVVPGAPGAIPQGYPYCQPQYQFGQVGVPQYGAQGARWYTPFLTGSGVYTPLLKLVPNKYGTYLGQGIIGQPTAYVDGEPLRNLLRYLAP